MKIEIEDNGIFTDEGLTAMATCDRCYDDHYPSDRDRIAKYHKAIEREMEEPRVPYKD